ncbi:F-box protein At5g49610 [Ziziphus jujuba]|uniref:F-box protein At5g49610 n=1 Tax=Ziziphus jujuba TaxID=326968 RepID=A0A6P4A2M4_ZIZJJ|nr:F-box protein At5g49610 [Ziziphus jujuba]
MDDSIVVGHPPDDIIFQILSRTSLKTLGRCRLLNKEWYETTYDSNFTQHFFKRIDKVISGFFIQDLKHPQGYFSSFLPIEEEAAKQDDVDENTKLSLSFLPPAGAGSVKILAAARTQGIILLCDYNYMRYYVCKPATKQWRTIPSPNTRRFSTKAIAIVVLGSHRDGLRFKIVRFSSDVNRTYVVRCEIFDSENWAWKRLNCIRLPDDAFLLSKPPAVSVRGKLYWLISKKQIFVFDLETESWGIFAAPKAAYENEYCYDETQLVEYQGRLGLIFMGNKECIQLWVLEDYNQNRHHHHHHHHHNHHHVVWRKRSEINIEEVNQVEPVSSPVGFCNADVLVMKGFFRMIFYKFQNNNNHPIISKVVRLDYPFTDARQVFFFQSDFEPVKFRN